MAVEVRIALLNFFDMLRMTLPRMGDSLLSNHGRKEGRNNRCFHDEDSDIRVLIVGKSWKRRQE